MNAIDVNSLSYRYPDGKIALENLTFQIADGEKVGLIGANGAGKSTLLLHLNGLLPERIATLSPIRIFNTPISEQNLFSIREQVGLLFQDPDDQLFCSTVEEDVGFGPSQLGLSTSEIKQRVTDALQLAGVSGYEARAPHRLSRGEKRRVCLAGLLACQAKILLLDEPTSDLDPRGRKELLTILQNLPTTQLIASHDLDFIAKLCTRVIILYRGKLVAIGETNDILHNTMMLAENCLL
ncbi:MAG: energy-coupling factor ABC transporter ATP-binding protein [bacterium]|nr:energy-coupling factor ABC transporter ATP-binding protein [bacterium]